jgi:DNA invertase Pin-like site-specific DNA recombinase
MRVSLYGRVSTANHGQDVGLQLSELRDYCARRGFEIMGEYVDHGISGAKDSRPALNRLMTDAHHRKFDAVCCWKLDRFGRSLKHLVNAIADLEALGIAFISLQDNLDLSTPSGRLMFHIIAAMAQFERSLIQERVRAGMRNAQAKGRQIGRRKAVFDPDQARSLVASGKSLAQVGAALGVSASTVCRSFSANLRRKRLFPPSHNRRPQPR